MSAKSRAAKAENLERWAEEVSAEELVPADTEVLQRLAQLADQRSKLDSELREAVISARHADRTWSEIGAMLGVSKQAAQRKFGRKPSAA